MPSFKARTPKPAYVPPHLRNQSGESAARPRTLDEIASHYTEITLQFSGGGPFSIEDCPDTLEPPTATRRSSNTDEQSSGLEAYRLLAPPCPDRDEVSLLLSWFEKASSVTRLPEYPRGDPCASLSLPPSLSKVQRAVWHKAAEVTGLQSASQGFGDERFLVIRSAACKEATVAAASQAAGGSRAKRIEAGGPASSGTGRKRSVEAEEVGSLAQQLEHTGLQPQADADIAYLPLAGAVGSGGSAAAGAAPPGSSRRAPRSSSVRSAANQIWWWCQLEGGALWDVSKGEIQELLSSGRPLPHQLQELVQRREAHAKLLQLIHDGEEAAAVALVEQQPKLAWTKEEGDASGTTMRSGYPAHAAAAHGRPLVLAALVMAGGPNVLEQKDSHRATPEAVAAAAGTTGLLVPVLGLPGEPATGCRQPREAARRRSSGGGIPPGRGPPGSQQQGAGAAEAVEADHQTGSSKTTSTWLERRREFARKQHQQA